MSERIKTIAKYINPYQRIADIGCDHGYLIVEAFKNGISFAQAIDNKKGPLQQAINNLTNYQENVEFSLGDGLDKLLDNIQVVVIAGMGGSLIIDILSNYPSKLQNVERLILQANRNTKDIRKFISSINYKITAESIIYEDGIYYEIIVCDKGYSKYNDDELTYGPILMKERSALFIKKWQTIIKNFEAINSVETSQKALAIKKVIFKEAVNES